MYFIGFAHTNPVGRPNTRVRRKRRPDRTVADRPGTYRYYGLHPALSRCFFHKSDIHFGKRYDIQYQNKKNKKHRNNVLARPTKLGRITRAGKRKLGVSGRKYTLVRSTTLEDMM